MTNSLPTMVTGMCIREQVFSREEIARQDAAQVRLQCDKEVSDFFKSIGYKMGWDRSFRLGIEWQEIYGEDGLVAQIDGGIPLSAIIQDLKALHKGREMDSGFNYTIGCKHNDPAFKLLCKRVAEAYIQQEFDFS